MILRLCHSPGVVQTRPFIYSDRLRIRMRVTVALRVEFAEIL